MDKDKLDTMYKRLYPPTPKLTRKQVEIARENQAFLGVLRKLEKMLFLAKVANSEIKPKEKLNLFTKDWTNKEIIANSNYLNKMNSLFTSLNDNEKRISESFISDADIRYNLAALTSPHAGDCVDLPTTCERCFAESFFNLKSTVNWSSIEGRKMIEALDEAGMWGVSDEEYFETKLENEENFKLMDLED